MLHLSNVARDLSFIFKEMDIWTSIIPGELNCSPPSDVMDHGANWMEEAEEEEEEEETHNFDRLVISR